MHSNPNLDKIGRAVGTAWVKIQRQERESMVKPTVRN